MGLSIVGDDFKPGDSELTTFPVMINQRLADLMNQDTRSLIGQKISMNGKNYHPIIGVVANTYVPGDSSNETYEVYLPKNYNGWRQYSFLISASDNALVVEQVRELALKIDPRLDISQLTTLKEQFDDKRQRHMAAAAIAIVLAVISLLMVCIGINGIVNYMVHVRRYSLGVKLAMGANNNRLLKDSLLELMQPVLMGLFFAFSLNFLLIGYGLSQPNIDFIPNWGLIAAIWFSFALLALLVSFFPVRTILLGDPIKALRND